MENKYSVVIVGAGSVGMATGYYLAKTGIDVLLIDTHNPPHDKGSHHGETRLIRHAVGEGEEYVDLALKAQANWHQLEKESGKTLFIPTGTLMVGESDAQFIQETVKNAKTFGMELEEFTAEKIKKQWPGFELPDHFKGYYEHTSGALLNEECILAYRQQLLKYNTEILENTKVNSLEFHENGVGIKTAKETFYAEQVIITVGAWIGELLSSLKLPIQTVRKTLGWYSTDELLYKYPFLPSFYFCYEGHKYYGFPDITGNGVKIGRNDSERNIVPDLLEQDFGKYDNDKQDLNKFVERFLPGLSGQLNYGRACMITKTPDKHFIIDRHPENNHVLIAGGFSGHGFKYASILGEILSQIVIDGESKYHIPDNFSISREPIKDHKVINFDNSYKTV
ncbi:N-methyl-L-tryptophan oxidase [Virgibacillus necropolis]|uniref:N-methyltryptophan oxidase n=1 Tax=Virgibacillus necropolis TaxID=163877 RepID=A0A221MFG0_9BACI|nr:N-methyl-L-tryptophan oxidase [Virgibacillus necropolis]ASN06365.1 N-methyltryptophan oxidase [Virgibacillus necropolis]